VYLINLATADREVRKKSRAALLQTVEVACAIEADGVVLHVGSHLGAGLDAGVKQATPALEAALGACDDRTWILLENSAGTGATIGRSVDELTTLFDRLDHHPQLGLCLDSCHLWVSGVDVTDPATFAATLEEVDRGIGLDRLRCLHVNDAAAELGSNRDRHANVLEGTMAEGLGVFLADPRVQGLPAILETPGPDNHGPDAAEVQRLKDLHARATGATRPGRSARRPGRTASRGGARRTRG
jgi:deoxyribonuclease-4